MPRLTVERDHALEDASLTSARVISAVSIAVTVTVAGSTLIAQGEMRGIWQAECRRCLQAVRNPFVTQLREVFEERPDEGETWPIREARIDLAPAARQAALLALPLAPLCAPDCAGPHARAISHRTGSLAQSRRRSRFRGRRTARRSPMGGTQRASLRRLRREANLVSHTLATAGET